MSHSRAICVHSSYVRSCSALPNGLIGQYLVDRELGFDQDGVLLLTILVLVLFE
jgi:hypothetical protein